MPDDADYIRMRGHINRVKAQFPALDPELIERICQNYIVVRRRRPGFKKLRARVVELTSDHDEPTLRGMLGLPPKTSARVSGRRRAPAVAAGDAEPSPRRRGPGRPRGTHSATSGQIVEAFRTFRAIHHRRPTQVQLATNLKPPVGVRTLQAILTAYGLPWPIE